MTAQPIPVIFIHGLWIHSDAWQPWVDLYGAAGYNAMAPGWPGDSASVEMTRKNAAAVADKGIDDITNRYLDVISRLPAKPIVIGHSFGGLIAQKLLSGGVAAAAIAIDPGQIKGVKPLPFAQIRSGLPVLSRPGNKKRAIMLTKKQFRYGFGNALTKSESGELFDRWAIPGPGKPLFEASAANFKKESPAAVDTRKRDRGPLLIVAGGKDHTVPEVVARGAYKLYSGSGAVTSYHAFPDRGHSLVLDHGWREVADLTLSWLSNQDLLQPRQRKGTFMRTPLKLGARKARLALVGLALAGLVAIPGTVAAASTSGPSHSAVKPTIVLEHGAWADGSSWSGVVTRLQKAGYTVDVPPNPLRGVDSDSAYLASYLATVPGPIVLVGHSYGGFVITNAATGDKNVKALVYVDAYIPVQGDTLNSLTSQFPGSQIAPAALNFVPSPGGVTDVYIKPSQFRSILANDLPASQAAELAATQRPIAASTLTDASGPPAWTSIPSWAVIGTADHAIPPAAQEFMARRAHATMTEINASHLSLISQPGEITNVIEAAADRTS